MARLDGKLCSPGSARCVTLFLCGDVMTGRGVDQILAHPGDPTIHEAWLSSALEYVSIAEGTNGPIPRQVASAYVWGDALDELARVDPDVRIVNLETAVTDHGVPWPKGINYRMHPGNVDCVASAVDCCTLANNHVLDWSIAGLIETVETLETAGIAVTGAGRDAASAWSPAVIEGRHGGRVVVLGVGARSSGIPASWRALGDRPGVALLTDRAARDVVAITEALAPVVRPGDVVVVAIHWGSNWGYDIPERHRRFARLLIDAGVHVVHGHSSHHPLGIEVYRGRPVLYGCGDLINDYEGIAGYEEYRSDLHLMYLPTIEVESGTMMRMELVPMRTRRFRLERASTEDAAWLAARLDRECRKLGSSIELEGDRLLLRWGAAERFAFRRSPRRRWLVRRHPPNGAGQATPRPG